VAALIAVTGMFAAASVATGRSFRRGPAASVAASRSFAQCATGYWCDYVRANGRDLCFKVSPFVGPGDIPNWGVYHCRNVDGAIYNNSPFTLRIYYGPHYRGPYACLEPFTKVRDLFTRYFNTGSGPHDLVIGNNIASSTISLTRCTKHL
jgi:hypothetical protein